MKSGIPDELRRIAKYVVGGLGTCAIYLTVRAANKAKQETESIKEILEKG